MADVYMYADETGNLDYAAGDKEGATKYFGFGTAVFRDDHGRHLFEGLKLRAHLEGRSLPLPRGFHAVNDSARTRNEVFQLIRLQAPRFDATFLWKAKAYPSVRARGQMYLYKMAWYLHFKEIATQVSNRGDTLYVIVGTFGTAARKAEAVTAVREVCNQVDRKIVLCAWEAATSWGLQVADYGLWAMQRQLERKTCTWYAPCVHPTVRSFYTPWGSEV